MHQGEDLEIVQVVSVAPLELEEHTVGMMVELYGIRIFGTFIKNQSLGLNKKSSSLKLRFIEFPKRLSCVIEIK
ncbi:hypothetical protein D5018_19930 [Parashewanella curva]|uniref:Uncharacterized protein n=2 Tax=Parashewanella curva TaxID=2338552 RepID=A0A3L8PRC9_9GAMM|nr:hypothetical protein D5018_19930 [Parashewanella curva]